MNSLRENANPPRESMLCPKGTAASLEESSELPGLDQPLFPRLGILNDYVRVPYANGSSFASQFLYREFRRRGSRVTVVGPNDPKARPEELPPRSICISSVPFRNHPGVQLSMPDRGALKRLADEKLSVLVAQTGSALLDVGVWLRRNHRVPLVCVNTIHMPSVYDVLLPQAVHKNRMLTNLFQERIVPWVESTTASVYNNADGLVVLSNGLKDYWRERGVTAPITVIPRSVDPSVFDQVHHADPFPHFARRGGRLLVVCRHTREKNVERLLKIFAERIAPRRPDATLTLVGDGPDHDYFCGLAERLGVREKCHFPGEVSLPDIPAWYRHADVFVYTSLSETYGQVVSEALWCGLPAVALDDDKGVSDQIVQDSDGFLIRPEAVDAEASFGARVLELLNNPKMRAAFSERAEAKARYRSDPGRCIEAYEATFSRAQQHCADAQLEPGPIRRAAPLVHMTAMHSLLAVLGCVRPPATVNRHGRKQPTWDGVTVSASNEQRPRLRSVPYVAA